MLLLLYWRCIFVVLCTICALHTAVREIQSRSSIATCMQLTRASSRCTNNGHANGRMKRNRTKHTTLYRTAHSNIYCHQSVRTMCTRFRSFSLCAHTHTHAHISAVIFARIAHKWPDYAGADSESGRARMSYFLVLASAIYSRHSDKAIDLLDMRTRARARCTCSPIKPYITHVNIVILIGSICPHTFWVCVSIRGLFAVRSNDMLLSRLHVLAPRKARPMCAVHDVMLHPRTELHHK